jgi:hypothetical protein
MAEQPYLLSHTADAAERERLELWEHLEEALVHKCAQPIEFTTFFDLTQQNVPC